MATNIHARFGARVRELREAAGESQDAFAGRTGLGRAYVGKLERGVVNATLATVSRVAKGLGVEVIELFRFGARGRAR